MAARPTVSWLLPVRDAPDTYQEAVASALAECGPDDEVVVVDDGSASPVRVPSDPRVHLIRTGPRGIVAALETGRAQARGAWIARLDADDVALPGRLRAQRGAMEDGVGAVGGRARTLPPFGPGMDRYISWLNSVEDPHRELLIEAPLIHPATTISASALAAVGGWRDVDAPEDYDLWLRLVDAGYRLVTVPEEVVALRDRPERLTRTDPRYRPAAHRRLKMDWLAPRLPATVGVWGANATGGPWIRWLRDLGLEVEAFDIKAGVRHGVRVRPREAVRDSTVPLLLVAVGNPAIRAEIRGLLRDWRPDLAEGRDWWAVA